MFYFWRLFLPAFPPKPRDNDDVLADPCRYRLGLQNRDSIGTRVYRREIKPFPLFGQFYFSLRTRVEKISIINTNSALTGDNASVVSFLLPVRKEGKKKRVYGAVQKLGKTRQMSGESRAHNQLSKKSPNYSHSIPPQAPE